MSLTSLEKVFSSETSEERKNAAFHYVDCLKTEHIGIIIEKDLCSRIKNALLDTKNMNNRDGAIHLCFALHKTFGAAYEPYCVLVLQNVINTLDDKIKNISILAEDFLISFFKNVNPYACAQLLVFLFEGMSTISWKIKVGCLKLLGILAHTAPNQIGHLLPNIVPKVTENMWDTKPEVKIAAKSALSECCTVIHNPDVKPIVPHLIAANANPKETTQALDRLMGTTFVSQVDRPTLAIIVPLLSRGLRDRDVQTKRKCCVVVDNMCKLVCASQDVEPFIDKLLPELKRVEEEVPIPEIRVYGAKAKSTLMKAIIDGGGKVPEKYI